MEYYYYHAPLLLLIIVSVTSNKPSFFSILEEEVAIGHIVADLKSSLLKASGDRLPASATVLGRWASLFRVLPHQLLLVTASRIDREDICPNNDPASECSISVDIQPENHRLLRLTLLISDINDNSPHFPLASIILSISEAAPVGQRHCIPSATDADVGRNGRLVFSMQNDIFRLEEAGEDICLILIRNLDRETKAEYKSVIYASDDGTPPLSSSIQINIKVQDANDNAPIFDSDVYEVEVTESVELGSILVRIHAEDADIEHNARISYAFNTNDEDSDKFSLDAETGELSTKEALDFETKRSFTLLIKASDGGVVAQTAFAKVVVEVTDDNDNWPSVLIHSLSANDEILVIENQPPKTFVALVFASDADANENGRVDCFIDFVSAFKSSQNKTLLNKPLNLYNNWPFEFKLLHAGEYSIVTTQPIDREKYSRYVVFLKCADNGQPSLTTSTYIDINISDLNDNWPRLANTTSSNLHLRISEDFQPGNIVHLLEGFDEDDSDNGRINYELKGWDNYKESELIVECQSGSLILLSNLDYELNRDYNYSLKLTDGGTPPLSTQYNLIIEVEDLNDEAPQFLLSSLYMYVSEDSHLGSRIGLVSSSDRDASQVFRKTSYALEDDVDAIVKIEAETGVVFLVFKLDREKQEMHEFKICAVNEAPPYLKTCANATIFVSDVNDNAPIFISPHDRVITVSQSTSVGSVILSVLVEDPDEETGPPSYYIKNNIYDVFKLDSVTGKLYLEKPLLMPQYKLIITAVDHGLPQLSAEKEFIIKVINDSSTHLNNFNRAYEKNNKSILANALLPLSSGENKNDSFSTTHLIIILSVSLFMFLALCLITIVVLILFKQRSRREIEALYRLKLEESGSYLTWGRGPDSGLESLPSKQSWLSTSDISSRSSFSKQIALSREINQSLEQKESCPNCDTKGRSKRSRSYNSIRPRRKRNPHVQRTSSDLQINRMRLKTKPVDAMESDPSTSCCGDSGLDSSLAVKTRISSNNALTN